MTALDVATATGNLCEPRVHRRVCLLALSFGALGICALVARPHRTVDGLPLLCAGLWPPLMVRRRSDAPSAAAADAAVLLSDLRIDAGLSRVLHRLAGGVCRLIPATRLMMACRQTAGDGAFLWSAERVPPTGRVRLSRRALDSIEGAPYFCASAPFWGIRSRERRVADFVALDHDGARTGQQPDWIPTDPIESSDACLGISVADDTDWTVRVFVIDARLDGNLENGLRYVATLVRTLSPVVCATYQYQQLHACVSAVERSALANTLHDGLLQSLIGVTLRVQTLRARLSRESSSAMTELASIERLLRREIAGVRDIMHAMKPLAVAPHELLDFIADEVHRFEPESGIRIRFHVDIDRVNLSAPRCTELARIIREALTNVRKHSGARNVSVRLTQAAGFWSLLVEDDGRGLAWSATPDPSAGRGRSALCFDSHGPSPGVRTPAVIRNCVRSLGGVLGVRPTAGGGLRLVVTFPAALTSSDAGVLGGVKPAARLGRPGPAAGARSSSRVIRKGLGPVKWPAGAQPERATRGAASVRWRSKNG